MLSLAASLGFCSGLFGSGIYAMVYRMIRHARGRHDQRRRVRHTSCRLPAPIQNE